MERSVAFVIVFSLRCPACHDDALISMMLCRPLLVETDANADSFRSRASPDINTTGKMNVMCAFLLFLPTVQADFAEEVQKASGASRSFLEDMQTYSTMAVNPFLQRIFLSQKELLALLTSIRTTVHWEDMIFMAMVGWCTVPSLQWPYQHTTLSRSLKPQTPFRQTFLYHVADHLQQIARIALLVYAVDILKMVCVRYLSNHPLLAAPSPIILTLSSPNLLRRSDWALTFAKCQASPTRLPRSCTPYGLRDGLDRRKSLLSGSISVNIRKPLDACKLSIV
jgi:hypothetical protein